MRNRANRTIACAEEDAQEPTYDADDDRSEERVPEAVHVKRRNHSPNEQEQQRINDEDKHSHGHEDKGEAQ